jgi:hypothetical protein
MLRANCGCKVCSQWRSKLFSEPTSPSLLLSRQISFRQDKLDEVNFQGLTPMVLFEKLLKR